MNFSSPAGWWQLWLLTYQTHHCHLLSTGIRQLQLILFKVALILGVEIHVNLEFVKVLEPPEDQENQSIIYHNIVLFTATSFCVRCYVKSSKAVELCLEKVRVFCPCYKASLALCSYRHDKYQCDRALTNLKIRPRLRRWGFALCLLACVWGFVGSLVWLLGIFLQKQILIDNINIEDGISTQGLVLLSHLI